MRAEAADLFGLDPSAFTAARNALAKQLKAEGDADAAAAIASLRKPKVAEHALNSVARTDPDVVQRFADAVSGAQKAQAAAIGGDAGALRDATAALRHANNELLEAGVAASGEAQRDDILGLLRDFISGADIRVLKAGILGAEALVTSTDLFQGAAAPPPATKSAAAKKPAAGTAPKKETAADRAAAKAAEAARALHEAERARLADAVAAAEKAERKAAAALDEAQDLVMQRKAALKAAQTAVKSAERSLAAFDD
jgi:hypothetical protein